MEQHPINIPRKFLDEMRARALNGDGYSYKYIPDTDNVSESFKMDGVRHRLAPTATDIANRAKRNR